jgi:Leucine rich repeat
MLCFDDVNHHLPIFDRREYDMPADSVSRPWRRFLRFSVRGLIVLVLVIGVGLGWIVRQAHIQRDAVAAILAAGGSVKYDWEWSNGKTIPSGKPWAPRWLINLIGVDYFGHVTAVEFELPYSLTDGPIVEFAHFTRLQRLVFTGKTMSVAGLKSLKGLAHLWQLDLARSLLTDTEAASLREQTSLKSLRLRSEALTDVGLSHLGGLTNLEELDLSMARITDAGLRHLTGLTKLSSLDLSLTKITDAGLVHLNRHTKLSQLDLY